MFQKLNDIKLKIIVENIKNLLDEIKPHTKIPVNYVCDIYVKKDLNVKIIEFNSFGYWLPAGSALFEWEYDYNKIYFRIYN